MVESFKELSIKEQETTEGGVIGELVAGLLFGSVCGVSAAYVAHVVTNALK